MSVSSGSSHNLKVQNVSGGQQSEDFDSDSSETPTNLDSNTNSVMKNTVQHLQALVQPPPQKKGRREDGDADKPGDEGRMAACGNIIELFAYDLKNKVALGKHSVNFEKHNKMLFSLCCSLVGVAIDGDRIMHLWDMYGKAEEAFQQVMNTYPKKKEWRDSFFKYLPGFTWPSSFVDDYLPHKKLPKSHYKAFQLAHKADIVSIRESNIQVEEMDKRLDQYHFGYLVWTEFLEVSSYIMYTMNKHWSDVIPSGETKVRMLLKLRKELIGQECHQKTYDSRRQAISKPRKQMPGSSSDGGEVVDVTGPSQDAKLPPARKRKQRVFVDVNGPQYVAKFNENLPKYNLSWYPNAWLCFVLLGKPSAAPVAKFVSELTASKNDKVKEESSVAGKDDVSSNASAVPVVATLVATTPVVPTSTPVATIPVATIPVATIPAAVIPAGTAVVNVARTWDDLQKLKEKINVCKDLIHLGYGDNEELRRELFQLLLELKDKL